MSHHMFTTRTRDNGSTFVTLEDNAPEWLRDAVREAHDGEMPNDWRFETCRAIWQGLAETPDVDHSELADSLVDIYTADLLAWMAGDISRTAYVDETTANIGHSDQGLAGDIMAGQCECIRAMVVTIAEALETAHAAYVDECEVESLEAHDVHMWIVHGCPTGPIGGVS